VQAIHRYTTSSPGSYSVALNGTCEEYSGGTACQYDLLRNGTKVANSAEQRWYNVKIASYAAGACSPSVAPHACEVRTDQSYTLP
jgi:hypothetical protein